MLPTPPTASHCARILQQQQHLNQRPIESNNIELSAYATPTIENNYPPQFSAVKMPMSVYDTPPQQVVPVQQQRRRFYGDDLNDASLLYQQQNFNGVGSMHAPVHAQQQQHPAESSGGASSTSKSHRLLSCFKTCFDSVDKCLYPICHKGGDDETFVPVSPRRRTLCLIGLFDIMIMFIIWLINAQIKGLQHNAIFIQEIINYNVTTSLFDTVALATVRFLLNWFFYGILRSRTIWWIALITAGSCGLIITKCFFYNFSQQHISPATSLDWIILVAAITMTWVEAWFCDYHVLGAEERERHAYQQQQLRGGGISVQSTAHGRLRRATSRTPLVPDNNGVNEVSIWQQNPAYPFNSRDHHYAASSTVFHTPRGERALTEIGDVVLPSITEDLEIAHEEEMRKQHLRDRAQSVFDFIERISTVAAGDAVWKLEKRQEIKFNAANDTNNLVACASDSVATVESMQTREVGKIFRLTGVLHCNLKLIRREMFDNSEQAPEWNKLLLESKRLEMIDDNTDVMYYVTSGFGPVSSRDFVSVRRCIEQHDEHGRVVGYMLSMVHCEHAQAPTPRAHVRGEEGPSAMIFRLADPIVTVAVADTHSLASQFERELYRRCVFTWYFKNDVKGWLPQKAVDSAFSSAMLQSFELFRKHFRQIRCSNGDDRPSPLEIPSGLASQVNLSNPPALTVAVAFVSSSSSSTEPTPVQQIPNVTVVENDSGAHSDRSSVQAAGEKINDNLYMAAPVNSSSAVATSATDISNAAEKPPDGGGCGG